MKIILFKVEVKVIINILIIDFNWGTIKFITSIQNSKELLKFIYFNLIPIYADFILQINFLNY